MVRVGIYDLPAVDIDDAVERLRKARTAIGQRNAKRDVFAEAMGLKGTGGQTYHIISAMAMYGLIETGSGEVQVTDLGELVLYGEPNEINPTKAKAIQNVEIFREIYQMYGTRPTDEQLRAFLRQKASITDLQNIPNFSARIGKLLNKNQPYVSYAEAPQPVEPVKGEAIGRSETIMETKIAGVIEIRPEDGKPYIIPLENIDLARNLVDAVLDELKKKKEQQS